MKKQLVVFFRKKIGVAKVFLHIGVVFLHIGAVPSLGGGGTKKR